MGLLDDTSAKSKRKSPPFDQIRPRFPSIISLRAPSSIVVSPVIDSFVLSPGAAADGNCSGFAVGQSCAASVAPPGFERRHLRIIYFTKNFLESSRKSAKPTAMTPSAMPTSGRVGM